MELQQQDGRLLLPGQDNQGEHTQRESRLSKLVWDEKHRENSPGIVSRQQNFVEFSHPVKLTAVNSWFFNNFCPFGGERPSAAASQRARGASFLGFGWMEQAGRGRGGRGGVEFGETWHSSSGITQKTRESRVGAAGKCSITLRAASTPE